MSLGNDNPKNANNNDDFIEDDELKDAYDNIRDEKGWDKNVLMIKEEMLSHWEEDSRKQAFKTVFLSINPNRRHMGCHLTRINTRVVKPLQDPLARVYVNVGSSREVHINCVEGKSFKGKG